MPDWFDELRKRWQRWFGWHWAVTDFLFGFAMGSTASMFVLAIAAARALLGRTIQGGEGSLGTGALIVAILSAPFLIWSTWIKHRTLGFQKEGHLTDRLAKAVEQLGAERTIKKDGEERTEPNLEVRIGGLLSLERIAQDSTAYDRGRDHVRVMEIICAYIRNNAPAKDALVYPGGGYPEWPNADGSDGWENHCALRIRWLNSYEQWLKFEVPAPREDIALALAIVERRSLKQRFVEAAHDRQGGAEVNWPFDAVPPEEVFREVGDVPTKSSIKYHNARLDAWQAGIAGYMGYRPDLSNVCLQNAELSGHNLSGIILVGARLEGSNLRRTKLVGAKLIRARLIGAKLNKTRFGAADLSQAQLDASDLIETQLEAANLSGASMHGTYLYRARLDHAVFWSPGPKMPDRPLRTAISGSAFRYLCLSNSRSITMPYLERNFGDASVILPEYLQPQPAHWPAWELDNRTFISEYERWRANPSTYTPPPKPTSP